MSIVQKIDFLLGDDLTVEAATFPQFFKKKLKAYGVSSPEDLKGAKRKKFFNEVDREWKAKNENLSEASVEATMMQFGPYATAKKLGILKIKTHPGDAVKEYPGSSYAYYHPEKTDTKIAGDKTDVKGFPGKHDANYHPEKQDQTIPGHKTDVKGFPGKHDVNYKPEQQDKKIPGNKGDVAGFPGKQDVHFNPNKQDQKIGSKDKTAVKQFPGTGKEHHDPKKDFNVKGSTKIAGDKTDVKDFPGDAKVRHKGVLGYDRDKRSDMTDPKPMTEMIESPNKKIQSAYEKILEQSTAEVEPIQKQFGPKKYADEKGLSPKKKKEKDTVTEEEWLEYEKEYGEALDEKWAKKVEIEKTGEHAGKSVEQLKKEIGGLKGKEGSKEQMGELLFALRSKTGWKKGKGAAGL